jgi:exodeoxyribonuclease VII large subunit
MSVSQLAEQIDQALRRGVPGPARVIGEVSGFRDRTHWYFDLKDESAVVNCVMFASAARRAPQALRDGVKIIVTGRVEFYAKGGKVSFIVDAFELAGLGDKDQELRRLIERFRERGALDPECKRPLPRFPSRVAVLTSRTGAALQDVLVTMRRRCPAVGVLLVDVPVQGDLAAGRIVDALQDVGSRARQLGVDAVLITRGGGSMEDLWCFNDATLAEAILACPIPVIAAIGHETDVTLAELVADERAATPTQAAMRLTPDVRELLRQIDSAQRRLSTHAAHVIALLASELREAMQRARRAVDGRRVRDRMRLERASARLERVRPAAVHAGQSARLLALERRLNRAASALIVQDRVDALGDRLHRAAIAAVKAHAARASALSQHLESISPQRVLERGFSCTFAADGTLVRSSDDVASGEIIHTRLAQGRVTSVVQGGESREGDSLAGPAVGRASGKIRPPRRPGAGDRGDEGAPSLFGGG